MDTIFFIFTPILVAHASIFNSDIRCENSSIEQFMGVQTINTVLSKNLTDVVCSKLELYDMRYIVPNMKLKESKFIGILTLRRYPLSRTQIFFSIILSYNGASLMTGRNSVSIKFGSIKLCEEDTLIIEIPEWDEIHVYSRRNGNLLSSTVERKIETLAQLNRYRKQEIETDLSCINSKDDVEKISVT